MGRKLVAQILMLRGNLDVVLDLLKEEADKERDADEAGRASRAARDGVELGARLARSMKSATDAAPAPKRARDVAPDDDDFF